MLKKFYKNNRIYCILMLISIFCVLLIGGSVIVHFITQSKSDNYGTRLENVSKYPVETNMNDAKAMLDETEGVTSANVRLQGRIIYVDVTVDPKTNNEKIHNIATTLLEKFSDEQKGFYDMQFMFKREGLAPYAGSKSSSNTVITWANYTFDAETTTTTKKKK